MEPKEDNIGLKFLMKKAELEALKDELESEEYRTKYPDLPDIYGLVERHSTVDDLSKPKVEKETLISELADLKSKYETEILPNLPQNIDIIDFNKKLDEYIKNKDKIREKKTDIEQKFNETYKNKTELESIIYIEKISLNSSDIDKWDNNYDTYRKNYEEIEKLFKDEELKSLFSKNTELFNWLPVYTKTFTDLDEKKFFKGINGNNQEFEKMKKNIKKLWGNPREYTNYNSHIQELKKDIKENKGSITPRGLSPRRLVAEKKIKKAEDSVREKQELIVKIHDLELQLEEALQKDKSTTVDLERIIMETATLNNRIKELEQTISDITIDKNKKNEEYDKKLSEIPEFIENKYKGEIERLTSEKSRLEATTEDNEQLKDQLKENQTKLEELKKKSEEEKARLQKEVEELKSDLTKSVEELTTKKEEIQTTLEKMKGEREKISGRLEFELKIHRENPEFFPLMLETANSYEKEGFNEALDKLLNYRPMNKFMFKEVFTSIENKFKDYQYMDSFFQDNTIPEIIYEDELFDKTIQTLKPTLQTR
jgi:hypothetical protein